MLIGLMLLMLFQGPLGPREDFVTFASSGEVVSFGILAPDNVDGINVYRKTGVLSSPTLLGTIPVTKGVGEYFWDFRMPSGTTPQYRLWSVTKKGTQLLDESNGVRVVRR